MTLILKWSIRIREPLSMLLQSLATWTSAICSFRSVCTSSPLYKPFAVGFGLPYMETSTGKSLLIKTSLSQGLQSYGRPWRTQLELSCWAVLQARSGGRSGAGHCGAGGDLCLSAARAGHCQMCQYILLALPDVPVLPAGTARCITKLRSPSSWFWSPSQVALGDEGSEALEPGSCQALSSLLSKPEELQQAFSSAAHVERSEGEDASLIYCLKFGF